jgi:hypothetical protein
VCGGDDPGVVRLRLCHQEGVVMNSCVRFKGTFHNYSNDTVSKRLKDGMPSVEFTEVTEEHRGLVCIIRILTHTVKDDEWESIIDKIRSFLKRVKKENIRYSLVIDSHQTVQLPIDRINDLYAWLERKNDILKQCLRCTTYLVSTKASEMVLNAALAVSPPVTPCRVCQCKASSSLTHGIPSEQWTDIQAYIDGNK